MEFKFCCFFPERKQRERDLLFPSLRVIDPVLWIRIRMDPHLKSPPRSAWRDADPDRDPGGLKENVQVH